jgi:hypothetical protein
MGLTIAPFLFGIQQDIIINKEKNIGIIPVVRVKWLIP